MRQLITLFVLLSPMTIVHAATPPCSTAPYQDWHFWLGTWAVTSPDGQPQGTNTISLEEKGCLLVERWRSVQGGTGQSYNYYNPATNQWRQLWVSQGAIIDYAGGLNKDGAMHLVGIITYQSNATTFDFRGTWSLQDDGTVLQKLEQYNAETSQWDNWFTGTYTKTDSE